MSLAPYWTDPDRRRAALLTLLVHALVLFLLVLWIDLDVPEREPPEQFLVIDLGSPAPAEAERPAPADDAPAPNAPAPAVAADTPGEPTPGTPGTETAGEATVEPEPVAEAPAPPSPAAPEPSPEEPAAATTPVEVPTPTVRAPDRVEPAQTPQVTAAVPEIESPELTPRPLAEALPVPTPSTELSAGAVALPDASPEVAPSQARTLEVPQANVQTRAAVGLEAPDLTVQDAPTRSLAAPSPQASTGDGRAIAAPTVTTVRGTVRELGTAPQAGVRSLRNLETPSVQASVRAAPADDAPGAAANVPPPEGPAGGDSPRAGQPGEDPLAAADARGLAGSPDGRPGDGGAPRTPPPPLREMRPRPLAVLIDNAIGYPQSGLPQASWIAEMPVEGGVTRLMAVFDQAEPELVGPVRSARDYFVEVAARSNSVLVHDGGSPSALVALQSGATPSLNAYGRGDLFSRALDSSAPYNLFTVGSDLRDAVRTLNIDANRLLTGFRPAPPGDDLPRADEVSIDWSGAYGSGFRYVSAQDRYRWIRNGEDAVDSSGQAVQVDAVLVARIEAREIPGDTAGRLYIPVHGGGPATLYWRGTAQEGTWSVDSGLRFTDADGAQVSLEALTTWAAFVPQAARVSAD